MSNLAQDRNMKSLRVNTNEMSDVVRLETEDNVVEHLFW